MSQLDELVRLIQTNASHRESLKRAESHAELVSIFMDIASTEGLYLEEGVIEAAIVAAQTEADES
ncbi:MAG: hypothetical protein RI549_01050 [Wenzhouxiangella sp.]|nr:hypothetical protein [Wenzhouxiangella sp.]